MKFRFIGGLDCPEWILSQIPELAKMNTENLQKLCLTIVERLKNKELVWNETDIKEIVNGEETTTMSGEVLRFFKAKVAAISFIFEKTAKNECSSRDLEKELLQLGLPPDQSNIVANVYESEQSVLKSIFLRLPIKAPSFAIVKRELLTTVDPGPAEDDAKFVRIQTSNSDGTRTKLIFDKEELSQLKQKLESVIKQLDTINTEQ